jgi:endonuclease YncB( thermonuclease family)
MKLFLSIIVIILAVSVQAKPQYGTVTVSKVISVYDGDTFRVNIDSLPPIVGRNIPIRVNGVDIQRYEESVHMRRI